MHETIKLLMLHCRGLICFPSVSGIAFYEAPHAVVRGDVTLVPSGDVVVCPQSITLFTCTVNGAVLRWTVILGDDTTGNSLTFNTDVPSISTMGTLYPGIVATLDEHDTSASTIRFNLTVNTAALDTTRTLSPFPIRIMCLDPSRPDSEQSSHVTQAGMLFLMCWSHEAVLSNKTNRV